MFDIWLILIMAVLTISGVSLTFWLYLDPLDRSFPEYDIALRSALCMLWPLTVVAVVCLLVLLFVAHVGEWLLKLGREPQPVEGRYVGYD